MTNYEPRTDVMILYDQSTNNEKYQNKTEQKTIASDLKLLSVALCG